MRAPLLVRLLAPLLLTHVVAVPLAAASPGASEGARGCTHGGYASYTGMKLIDDNLVKIAFKNTGECVSYVARGGTLVPLSAGSGGEFLKFGTTAVYGVTLTISYPDIPPSWIQVCGFSEISGAISGNPDLGERTGIAKLYLGSVQFSQGVWITEDCVTIFPQPGGDTFPRGEYRLDVTVPPSYNVADFVYFPLP